MSEPNAESKTLQDHLNLQNFTKGWVPESINASRNLSKSSIDEEETSMPEMSSIPTKLQNKGNRDVADPETMHDELFMIDVSAAFELDLVSTDEYKQAYEKYTTPLNISEMASDLQDLVDECSANVTGPEFCNICVRPIGRLEMISYGKHMHEDNIPDDMHAAAMHAIYDRAGATMCQKLNMHMQVCTFHMFHWCTKQTLCTTRNPSIKIRSECTQGSVESKNSHESSFL